MIEPDQVTQLSILFVGFCIGLIIDILWWVCPAFQKSEKGFEVLEHFHIAQILFIGFLIVGFITKSDLALFLLGMGVAFFLAEWSQSKEIHHKKVIPGHPFAYKSSHFRSSAVIGIILTVIAIISYVYFQLL